MALHFKKESNICINVSKLIRLCLKQVGCSLCSLAMRNTRSVALKNIYIKLLFMHHRRGFLSIPLNYIKHQFFLCEFWSVTDGAHWTPFSDLRAWRSLARLDSPDCLNLHAHYVLKMMKLAIIWAVSLIIHFSLNCRCPRPTPFFKRFVAIKFYIFWKTVDFNLRLKG